MSKKFLAAATLIATTLLSSVAFAAAQSKVGEVKAVDAAKNSIVLSTGETIVLPSATKADQFKVGQKVDVTFETKDGVMTATKIAPAK